MIMKDLTHYFNSPKEEETAQKVKKAESPVEIVEEKPPSKKKKVSLTKSKNKKSNPQEDKKNTPLDSYNLCDVDGKVEEPSLVKPTVKKDKKRKIEDDTSSACKKIKTISSSKTSLNKGDSKINSSSDAKEQTMWPDKNKTPTKNIISTEKEKVSIVLENNASCDELFVRRKRKPKKNLFYDSDEKSQPTEIESQSSAEKLGSCENNSNIASRNSLFSYFNKVDKVTALKQQKPEKIEVKAIVHCSPNGDNIGRQSLDGIHTANKTKRHKQKRELVDGDIIEVISSEEIVDENSSTTVNVPLETEQNRASLLNIEREPNKPKPSNLASIFMPKKIVQLSKGVENICSSKPEKDISVEESEKVICEKQTKSSKGKKALSRSKVKNVKVKKLKSEILSGNKQSDCHIVEDELNLCIESKSQGKGIEIVDIKSADTVKPNGSVKTSVSAEEDLVRTFSFSSGQESLGVKKSHNKESARAVKSVKNTRNSDIRIPEKRNCQRLNSSNNEEVTPKKKECTINGYFTPKSKSSSTNSSSSEKSNNNSKSPWVMKVCLSSVSKSLKADSEDEYKEDSLDSAKGTNEELCISQGESADKIEEDEVDPEVVIIDDDGASSSPNDKDNDNGKRRSLPRNAKNPKQIIAREDEDRVKPQPQKPPVKMWPFFQKGSRQPKEAPVDEAKLKAKILFLESGVPEIIKRKVETVKSDVVLGYPAPFPTVSHVMQGGEKTNHCEADAASLPLPPIRGVSPSLKVPAWTTLLPRASSEEPEIPVFDRPGNVKAFLEKLKEEEPKTDVKAMYKKLKEYKSKAESDIWTEVYKPTSSADVVGNSESIKKLKTWLETLKNFKKREGSVSSGDEFVSEDSDGEDNSFNNMAVICGPCGCGKTSAVYAIAKELDIKVLEINASCNRSGKRVLAEFSESTQSHHVERSQPVNGFFNNQNSGKKKRKKSKISKELKSEKTSLILVEDADLLFSDCDEGFVPALASLAASSKRPIVLVTNQTHTPHLDRFNNAKLLRLTFSRPRPNKLGLWLRLVGLVEGVVMPTDLAQLLVNQCNCDVRRCLLQLQLMVHSNNSEVKEKLTPSRLWWGWPAQHKLSYELPTILEPEEEEPRPEADRKLVLSQLQDAADTTRRLSHLDIMLLNSRTECLEDHEDPCPVAWASRWKDSTALTVPFSRGESLGLEAAWLQQALADGLGQNPSLSTRTGQTPQEARWLSLLRQGEQLYMTGIATTSHTSHQSVACDYLPMLRELGRSEQIRLANYTRRANRFFNYLQGLGIHASKSYRDFMCDAFS